MASEIGERIGRVIDLDLTPRLKKAGFVKTGRSFHKTAGEAIQVINIQSDKYNFGFKGKFTVNLGVFFPAVFKIAYDHPIKGKPKEYQCALRRRLGHLMPVRKDWWWALSEMSDDTAIAADLAKAMCDFGLPWLTERSDIEWLRRAQRGDFAGSFEQYLAAKILLGKREEARKLLLRKMDSIPLSGIRHFSEWGRKRGLL
jgi:hypothetical protein